jgi:hypothetical protein
MVGSRDKSTKIERTPRASEARLLAPLCLASLLGLEMEPAISWYLRMAGEDAEPAGTC